MGVGDSLTAITTLPSLGLPVTSQGVIEMTDNLGAEAAHKERRLVWPIDDCSDVSLWRSSIDWPDVLRRRRPGSGRRPEPLPRGGCHPAVEPWRDVHDVAWR